MVKSPFPKPYNRAGTWYLVKRVPTAYRELERRGTVKPPPASPSRRNPKAVQTAPNPSVIR